MYVFQQYVVKRVVKRVASWLSRICSSSTVHHPRVSRHTALPVPRDKSMPQNPPCPPSSTIPHNVVTQMICLPLQMLCLLSSATTQMICLPLQVLCLRRTVSYSTHTYFSRVTVCAFSAFLYIHFSNILKCRRIPPCLLQWQIPLKMLQPRNPPNLETEIPRYKFTFNQNLHLTLYREIPRNLSFSIWRKKRLNQRGRCCLRSNATVKHSKKSTPC